MSGPEIMDIMREALWVAFVMSLPILGVALVVGVAIGLVQALTSVQELTLTFVPKLGAVALTFWICMSFMTGLAVSLFQDRIIPLIAGAA
ncbi:MAG: flagellar biosynthetic protein FliQ [Pseudomonadota bacterium]